MTPRMRVAALALLVGWVGAASARAVRSQEADAVLAFRLSDQFGRVQHAEEYRGRAVVIVGAASGGRAVGTAWVELLRGLQADTEPSNVVPVVAIADLRGVPRLLRRLARGKFPRDRGQPVLLDWDGSLARQYAFDRDRCTMLLIGPAGETIARTSPGAVDTAAARDLLRQAVMLTRLAGANAASVPPR